MSRRIIATTAAIFIAAGLCLFAVEQPVAERPLNKLNSTAAPATNALEKILAWNKMTNELEIESGAMRARFKFSVTNISKAPVTLLGVETTCFCTAAHLPQLPKTLKPRESLDFDVDMNISGKFGQVTKGVTLTTDKGAQELLVISNIKPTMTGMTEDDRKGNIQMATADRQAVFRADCARCHVEPTRNKSGKELYAAACGICHEAEHRATMVPDLHKLPVETSAAFWSTWITYGKPNTLMPAFAQDQGGILTPEQITSLVDYLVEAIPPHPVPATVPKVD